MEEILQDLCHVSEKALNTLAKLQKNIKNRHKDIFLDMTDGMEEDDVKLQKARIALIEKVKNGDLDDYIFITEITDYHSGYELHKTNIEVIVPDKEFYNLVETKERAKLKEED